MAIVPLGLTRYLNDPRLTPTTPESCRRTIEQVTEIQRDLYARLKTNFAFLGDEIYLRAGVPVPTRNIMVICRKSKTAWEWCGVSPATLTR